VENMKLWESVCRTDPSTTKQVNQRGGFTAIDAQHQLQRATELWGPYGGDWGVEHCEYNYVRNYDSNNAEDVVEIWLEATFYCPVAEFEISTDIKFKPGNDSRKKLLTDLTTKALSKLGFNADVFEGKFDDNKYVTEMRKEFSKPKEKPVDETPDRIQPIDDKKQSIDDIPDDIEDVVKVFIKTGRRIMGDEGYKIWHSRVLSNYFQTDSINGLDKVGLSRFAEMQSEMLKLTKED
jgi:hypothetical protein